MRQKDLNNLTKLKDYYAKNRVMPSFAELTTMLGLKSTGGAALFVKRLKAEGWLESAPNGRLQPGPKFFEREVFNPVPAGNPETAESFGLGTEVEVISIDQHLIDTPSRTFLMRISGNFLKDAGLLDGDTVIVKKSAPTEVGDIVVANVNGLPVVRQLAKDNNGFYLLPDDDWGTGVHQYGTPDILGVVVGSFRKYKNA